MTLRTQVHDRSNDSHGCNVNVCALEGALFSHLEWPRTHWNRIDMSLKITWMHFPIIEQRQITEEFVRDNLHRSCIEHIYTRLRLPVAAVIKHKLADNYFISRPAVKNKTISASSLLKNTATSILNQNVLLCNCYPFHRVLAPRIRFLVRDSCSQQRQKYDVFESFGHALDDTKTRPFTKYLPKKRSPAAAVSTPTFVGLSKESYASRTIFRATRNRVTAWQKKKKREDNFSRASVNRFATPVAVLQRRRSASSVQIDTLE